MPMHRRFPLPTWLWAALCLLLGNVALAEEGVRLTSETVDHQALTVTLGKTLVIKSPQGIRRMSVASSGRGQNAVKVVDAVLIRPPVPGTYPQQLVLTGRSLGGTNITLWGRDNQIFIVLDVDVSPDVTQLKQRLHEILPDEQDIRVVASRDKIILSGSVSGTARLEQVLALAGTQVPSKDKIVNLLEVAGVHQVMLEVRISEMSKSLLQKLGFNFNFFNGGDFGISLLNNLTSIPEAISVTASPAGVSTSSGLNGMFRFHAGGTWTGFIDALKENGLVKVLAEPTLIALSGQTASFLAGGEFPIPVPQGGASGNAVTIDYKHYGVGLSFTPTVLSSGKISMQVAPEVSELDASNAVYISGYVVPALTTRRVSTVIELGDGQSFAIAGLLKESTREVVSKFPLLGDIPIIGILFRSSQFQKNESELVVIVTPHLVKPLPGGRPALPTDAFVEPNAWEFYLLGMMEGRGGDKPAAPPPPGGVEGEFGHVVP